MFIAVPANKKANQISESEDGNNSPDFFIYKAVFNISQTEEIDKVNV